MAEPPHPDIRSQETARVLDSLTTRFNTLLSEIDAYKAALAAANRSTATRFNTFDSTIKQDLKHVQKLRTAGTAAATQALASSNLPFFEATWDAAKRARGLVAFRQKFHCGREPRGRNVVVDVVAESGGAWVKVATLTERRLVHDIAKEGWGLDDDGDDGYASNSASDADETSIPLLRLARDLAAAARANRVRYHAPRVRLLLPRMSAHTPQVRGVLAAVRATGVCVELGASVPAETADIATALPAMLATDANQNVPLTPTLNLDTTVLLSLISDISHDAPEPGTLDHPHKRAQAAHERSAPDQLLPAILYPALAGRDLVCTAAAHAQLLRITGPIASPREHARAALLFADTSDAQSTRTAFAALSRHALPATLRLPLTVLPDDGDEGSVVEKGYAPDIAAHLASRLAPHNASVFLHGWRAGQTTLTSNWAVARAVEAAIERARLEMRGRDRDVVSGPRVWVVPLARSLAGLEKGPRQGSGRNKVAETGACGDWEEDGDVRGGGEAAAS